MPDTETELRELMHETSSWNGAGQVGDADRIAGARRYAVRARRVRVVGTAAAVAAAILAGGVVASGALRDQTLAPATPLRTWTSPALPVGPSWKDTAVMTDAQGRRVTLSVAAVISKGGSSAPDPQNRGKQLFTVPVMAGYYTLTNDTTAATDVGAPVQMLAYWKVPAGFCTRYGPLITVGGWPVPKVAGGQELCPMAAGDSTLPGTPQTLKPRTPLLVHIESITIGPDPRGPLSLSPADAATAVRITASPPVGWIAFDDDFRSGSDSRVASTGMPPP